MRFLECKNLVLRFSLRSKIYLHINFEYKFSLLVMARQQQFKFINLTSMLRNNYMTKVLDVTKNSSRSAK